MAMDIFNAQFHNEVLNNAHIITKSIFYFKFWLNLRWSYYFNKNQIEVKITDSGYKVFVVNNFAICGYIDPYTSICLYLKKPTSELLKEFDKYANY